MGARKGRAWQRVAVGALAVGILAVAGMGFSAYLFSRWSDLRSATPAQADRAFSEAIVEAGGGAASMEIGEDGTVRVRPAPAGSEPAELAFLHVLLWDPERSNLLQTSFPFWFVKLKTTDSVNLGTLTSALARDWKNLDLKLSVEELERRGPGLVLDHRLAGGSRILLWTEARSGASRR